MKECRTKVELLVRMISLT